MKFEYDGAKSEINKEKHGIDFEGAKALWYVLSVDVEARSIDEPRFMKIGKINQRFYSAIYTLRGEAVRLISVRRSRLDEEEIYNDCISR
jgi:uncharacterized DUF497 family protein